MKNSIPAPSYWGKHTPCCINGPQDIKHKPKYNEEYDSYYCEECNEWLEEACSDEECNYCRNRPEKPLGQRYD